MMTYKEKVTPSYTRNRKIVLAFAALLCIVIVVIRSQDRHSLAQMLRGSGFGNKKKTAIVVLGGGVDGEGKVYPHTELRIEKAIQIFNTLKKAAGNNSTSTTEEVTLMPLSGGTTHKPPPQDMKGFPIHEATSAAKIMLTKYNIQPSSIRIEPYSLDTLGNSYFLRTLLTTPGKYNKCIIITNNWHMPRVKEMFSYVFSLPDSISDSASDSASVSSIDTSKKVELEFIAVEDGLLDEHLLPRIEREKKSLLVFNTKIKNKFHSLEELSQFIFTEHKAYSASEIIKDNNSLDEDVDAAILATY